ncbi:MAG TPA: hypothetical protein VHC69_30125 [Polyangiaceae bacterium]|nr:hypothetical protein [Polyangiaceae bacterium]
MTPRMKSPPEDELQGYLNGALTRLQDPRCARRPELLASVHRGCAVFGYGAGLPMRDVKQHIDGAIDAYLAVQHERPGVEVLSTAVDGEYPDYWHAASNYTLQYLYWALTLGDAERSRRLSDHIWDPEPPAIPEVFPIFRIAYAVRDVVLGKNASALAELARIGPNAKGAERREAQVVEAVAREDGPSIVESLHALARGHRDASSGESLVELRILCVPAAGLASFALDCRLIESSELPQNLDAFPSELVLDGRA